jgi:hypothetical protein
MDRVPHGWRAEDSTVLGLAQQVSDIRGIRTLHVVLMSIDERLAAEVERVCSERSHRLTHVNSPGELHAALAASTRAVALFDAGDAFGHGLRVAATVHAAHPTVPLVLVTEAPSARSIDGFRVVDRWRAGERLVDELELAHIGIPATIAEPIRRTH